MLKIFFISEANTNNLKKTGEEILGNLRIGVDLDENVVDLVATIRPLILKKLSVDVGLASDFYFQEWEPIKNIPGGSEFVEKIFQREQIYEEANPVIGAPEVLNKWKAYGHQIWFITARAEKLRQVTMEWLGKNQLDWAKKYLLFRNSFEEDRVSFKACEVSRLNLHIFIEDQAEAVRNVSSPSMMVKLVLRYPWNIKEEIGCKAEFVETWNQIDRIVQEATRSHSLSHTLYVAQC